MHIQVNTCTYWTLLLLILRYAQSFYQCLEIDHFYDTQLNIQGLSLTRLDRIMSESYKLKGTKSQYESTNVYNRAMKLMNAQKSSVSLSKPHGLLLAT